VLRFYIYSREHSLFCRYYHRCRTDYRLSFSVSARLDYDEASLVPTVVTLVTQVGGPIANKMSLVAFPGVDHEIRCWAKANSKQGLSRPRLGKFEILPCRAGTLLLYVNKKRVEIKVGKDEQLEKLSSLIMRLLTQLYQKTVFETDKHIFFKLISYLTQASMFILANVIDVYIMANIYSYIS